MADTTAKGIVYPDEGDFIDDLNAVFATLASSVDTVLDDYITTDSYATSTEVTTGTATDKVVSPSSLRDAGVYAGDTGWTTITSSVSVASGWTAGSTFSARARRVGNIVQLQINGVEKASSPSLSVGVTGNIANTAIVTGVPSQFRPGQVSSLGPQAGGRANAYYIDTSGSVFLSAVVPSANWTGTTNFPTGEGVSCGGTYFGA